MRVPSGLSPTTGGGQRIHRISASVLWSYAIERARGAVERRKLDRCGPGFRAVGRIRRPRGNGVVEIGSHVLMWPDVKLSLHGRSSAARLVVGDRTAVGDRSEIHCASSVTIGSDCLISWDVVIMDHDYHGLDCATDVSRPVTIGDGVWIGCRVLILKGVSIGSGAVVAAGSVVTADVPPQTLVAGNPARAIRRPVSWTR